MLIVETIETEGTGARAGIQVGDHLMSYAGTPLLSTALWQALEENTVGIESVTVQVERDGQPQEFVVPIGKLGLQTRPVLPAVLLPSYEAARLSFLAGNYAVAAQQWTDLAEQIEEDAGTSVWLLGCAGGAWERAAQWDEAIRVYSIAWERLAGDDDTAMLSQMVTALGRCNQSRSEWERAIAWYKQAEQTDGQTGREMWRATRINNLGNIAYLRGDLVSAQNYFRQALEIKVRIASDSLEVAASLNNLGIVAHNRGDLSMAQDYFRQALEIEVRLAPDSLEVAASLSNLGVIAQSRGDLSAAQDYYRQALEIEVRLAPDSLEVAASLINIGVIAQNRGDLSMAQDYFRRALEIQERLAPDSLHVAFSLNNLGTIAWSRGDLSAAQDYYRRALGIRERLAPDSLDVAHSLNNLGSVAWSGGDFSAAQDYYRLALEIRECLAPDSLDMTESLNNLGIVACSCGDLSVAQDYHRRVLKIRERLAPGSLDVAVSLNNLGAVDYERGDLSSAQDYYWRALEIKERLAPGSLNMAESLNGLGRTFLRRQQPACALRHLLQAVQILEHQRAAIKSSDARALLFAQHTTKYASLIQCYLALQQPDEAFATLERSRARSLLELLAERQFDFTAEAPAKLQEEQRTLDQQRERTYAQLAHLSANAEDREQVEHLHLQLRDLERQQQELTAQLRTASPRYASLHYPQPLSLADSQVTLEPGTLLLAYLVDEEQTFLFAVTEHDLQAFTLPIGRKSLQTRVQSLRDLLDWRLGINRVKANVEKAIDLCRELYADLIQPTSTLLKPTQRLLLCPDGPLHILPFAALVTNQRGVPSYLGAERPLQNILSATLYARSKKSSHRNTPEVSAVIPGPAPIFPHLLALGDPVYPFTSVTPSQNNPEVTDLDKVGVTRASSTDPADAILAELQTRGLSLERLPHTRTEVLALERLFGAAATVKLGAEATKRAALTLSTNADVLHFACHGFVDARMPLSSGLVLSRSETTEAGQTDGDNGLLQVWEIFQKLRLDAELVVLSACETGLGQEVRGEGLIGLTRAFQYAGARNLVVSLWAVNDASTSVFMEGFYGALQSGARKEEAMQAGIKAVVSAPAHPEWKAPYYWSAFVLIGSRN